MHQLRLDDSVLRNDTEQIARELTLKMQHTFQDLGRRSEHMAEQLARNMEGMGDELASNTNKALQELSARMTESEVEGEMSKLVIRAAVERNREGIADLRNETGTRLQEAQSKVESAHQALSDNLAEAVVALEGQLDAAQTEGREELAASILEAEENLQRETAERKAQIDSAQTALTKQLKSLGQKTGRKIAGLQAETTDRMDQQHRDLVQLIETLHTAVSQELVSHQEDAAQMERDVQQRFTEIQTETAHLAEALRSDATQAEVELRNEVDHRFKETELTLTHASTIARLVDQSTTKAMVDDLHAALAAAEARCGDNLELASTEIQKKVVTVHQKLEQVDLHHCAQGLTIRAVVESELERAAVDRQVFAYCTHAPTRTHTHTHRHRHRNVAKTYQGQNDWDPRETNANHLLALFHQGLHAEVSDTKANLESKSEALQQSLADGLSDLSGKLEDETQSLVQRIESSSRALHLLQKLMGRADSLEIFAAMSGGAQEAGDGAGDGDGAGGPIGLADLQAGFRKMGEHLSDADARAVIDLAGSGADGAIDPAAFTQVSKITREAEALSSRLTEGLSSFANRMDAEVSGLNASMSSSISGVNAAVTQLRSDASVMLEERMVPCEQKIDQLRVDTSTMLEDRIKPCEQSIAQLRDDTSAMLEQRIKPCEEKVDALRADTRSMMEERLKPCETKLSALRGEHDAFAGSTQSTLSNNSVKLEQLAARAEDLDQQCQWTSSILEEESQRREAVEEAVGAVWLKVDQSLQSMQAEMGVAIVEKIEP